MTDPDPRQFYVQLGRQIRHSRQAKLSQEQLAKASGLSRTSIVNIECGRQKVLVHNLFEIARALNVSPTQLLSPLESKEMVEIDFSSAGTDADWIQRSLLQARVTEVSQ